ncbi:site-specific integrase [Pseudomonas alliivorans]|nr:site-specific integrase [Pseudomonas alliivorans]
MLCTPFQVDVIAHRNSVFLADIDRRDSLISAPNHTQFFEVANAPTVKIRLFSEWLEEYRVIYAERGLSFSSNKNVGMRIKRLDVEFGKKDTRSITTIDVAGYLTRMAKEGKAQMSRAMRSLLRDTFMEAMAAGWTNVNPVEVTKAARVVIKRERLTLELWKAIHEEAKQP